MILAGDIGGTKTVLALYSAERGVAGGAVREARFDSGKYDSLESVIRVFLRDTGLTPSVAAFGVAGPVEGGRSQITNLSWAIDAQAIGTAFGIPKVFLLNDLQSIALAVPRLQGDDLATLHPGAGEAQGNRVVVAPGTGLGIGFLIWDGERYGAQASEAGHTSFAPRSAVQIRLLEHLIGRYGHVSFERVCSGSFLPNIYDFLRQEGGYPEPEWLRQQLEGAQDRTPVIVQAALAHKADLCEATLDVFVSALGTVAGNMALSLLATGGIYLGGGIPPRILERLRRPDFLGAIADKGRFGDFLARIPVHVIRDPKVALHGAAWFAQDYLAGGRHT